MTYPGNEALSQDIKKRILETFRQTLELASQANRQEALLGCDFVLRLDPLFEPARILQSRLQTGERVEVDDLHAALPEDGAGPAAAEEPEAAAAEEPQADAATEEPEAAAAEEPQADAESPAESVPDFSDLGDLELGLEPADDDAPPPNASAEEPAADLETMDTLPALDLSDEDAAPPEAPAAPEPEATPGAGAGPLLADTEPEAALDADSENRIRDLLAEGQAAFDRTEYQGAIDAWSRIFLIDIDHPEANRRIELARKLKAEVERKLEESMHEGISLLHGGELDKAKAAFGRVLEIQPNHVTAREYLDKLEAGFEPAPAAAPPAPAAAPAAAGEPAAAPDGEAMPAPEMEAEEAAAGEARRGVVPIRKPRHPKDAAPERDSRSRLFILIGSAVLVLVVIGGWLLWSNRQRAFPNATTPPATSTQQVDPIARALELHEQGKTSIAVAQLKRLPPTSSQYEEAQVLIAQWEAAAEAGEGEGAGPTEEQLAARERLIAEAREAYAEREFFRAEQRFAEAAAIAPLDGAAAGVQAEVRVQLEPVRTQIEVFRQGEWEYALRDLWRMRQNDPRNRDVLRLMVDCYYNLGVRDLQRGDTLAASKNFEEALGLNPDEPSIRRLAVFAKTYQERPEDLLYRIFVKYLPFR